ncbi:hypothetical protein [Rhodoferax sp.]
MVISLEVGYEVLEWFVVGDKKMIRRFEYATKAKLDSEYPHDAVGN